MTMMDHPEQYFYNIEDLLFVKVIVRPESTYNPFESLLCFRKIMKILHRNETNGIFWSHFIRKRMDKADALMKLWKQSEECALSLSGELDMQSFH